MVHVAILEENEGRQLELKNFLNAQPELTCTFACSSIDKFKQVIGTSSEIQVVVININEDASLEIPPSQLREMKVAHPGMEILILADNTDTKKVINWLRAGVVGCLPRHTPLSRIEEAIKGIQHGEAHIEPFIIRQMLDFFRSSGDDELVLTDREVEVVQCLTEGLSYKLIALKLNVALDTVRFHLRNIYKKLNVNSNAQVICKAVTGKWKT